MSTVDLYLHDTATTSRPCAECGVTVTIQTPTQNGFGSQQEDWAAWKRLVRSQVCWPLMCDDCRAWWNERVGLGASASAKRKAVA